MAAKKSLVRGLVLHNAETNSFKAVAGRKVGSDERQDREDITGGVQGTKTKHERKEEKDRERREKKERRRERKEKKMRKLQLQKNVSSSTEESPKVGLTFYCSLILEMTEYSLFIKKLTITAFVQNTHVLVSVFA